MTHETFTHGQELRITDTHGQYYGPKPHTFDTMHPVMTDLVKFTDGKGKARRILAGRVTAASDSVRVRAEVDRTERFGESAAAK